MLQKYVRLRFSERRVSLVNLPLNSPVPLEIWLEFLARVIIVIYVEIRRESWHLVKIEIVKSNQIFKIWSTK